MGGIVEGLREVNPSRFFFRRTRSHRELVVAEQAAPTQPKTQEPESERAQSTQRHGSQSVGIRIKVPDT